MLALAIATVPVVPLVEVPLVIATAPPGPPPPAPVLVPPRRDAVADAILYMSKNKGTVENLRQSTNALLVEYWTDLKALSRLELEKVIEDLEAPVLRVAVAKGLLECARTGMSARSIRK